MDKKTAINKVKQYARLVTSAYSTNKIVLYGSYAKNNFNKNSDIDVAVIVDSIGDDFLSTSIALNKLTRNVDYRIEPVLVDEKNDRSGFVFDILKYGIIIYDRNTIT
ncbi:MAG: nucleotidyltransferase domain-containing protein [Cyclobacteriaceae bacterium]|nr:nucleotidyltransferase domain-containing protein [Cyclobacteriaceae bacterium]